jgi:hypothetical protein
MFSSNTAQTSSETVDIENLYSTTLYVGTGATQTINTGTATPAGDAMTWIKSRTGAGIGVFDTIRGIQNWMEPTSTTSAANTGTNWLNSLTSSSFGLNVYFNNSATNYVAWTFKKQPKFFDIVTWTGDGVAGRQLTHSLTTRPGFVIIKRINGGGQWYVYHRGEGTVGFTNYLTSEALFTDSQYNTNITATTINIMNMLGGNANAIGGTYVAYLFASDAGGFGPLGTDSVIKCNRYFGNGAAGGQVINCGFEAQWVLIKNVADANNWFMIDTTRGWLTNGDAGADRTLNANFGGGEGTEIVGETHAQGFRPIGNTINANGQTYIYVAIRMPSKIPKLGTEVLHIANSSAATGTKITTGFPFDMQIQAYPTAATTDIKIIDRKRGFSSTATESAAALLTSDFSAAETTPLVSRYWDTTGFQVPSVNSGISTNYYSFKRAPGFFDIVTYTGNGGIGLNIPHALTVVPEFMIVRARSAGSLWSVYSANKGNTQVSYLQSGFGWAAGGHWNNTTPTASQFTLGNISDVNSTGVTYVAYLFATLPGVSKVGIYTGTGGVAQTIDCGFTTGARLVLLKRGDATNGLYYLFDTAQGITSGIEPYMYLHPNSTAGTGSNFINPAAVGFTINANADMNQNGIPYVFLAIA